MKETFKKEDEEKRQDLRDDTEKKDRAAFIEYEKSIAEKPGGPKVAITKAQDDRITQIQQESQVGGSTAGDSGGGYETSPTSNQEDNVGVSTSDFSGFGKEDIFQFDLPKHLQAEPLEELELEIITQQAGEEVVLKNVSFASNSYELEKTSFVELDKLIAYLKKNPNLQIEIQGHTDDVGNEIENQRLSEQRANVVFEYLSSKVNNTD